LNRRKFIKDTSILLGGLSLPVASSSLFSSCAKQELFKISLAEWSLHRELFSKKIDHLDFISLAKTEFGISAVEYVNSFFFDKATNKAYLREMKARSDDYGVLNLLIMCDNEGSIGDQDKVKQSKAIDNPFCPAAIFFL